GPMLVYEVGTTHTLEKETLLLRLCERRLLLGEHLLKRARALDGELLDFTRRRCGQFVEERRDLLHVARLEERFEIIVREAYVALHHRLVRGEKFHDFVEFALLPIESGEAQQGERILRRAVDRLFGVSDRLVARLLVLREEALERDVRRRGPCVHRSG